VYEFARRSEGRMRWQAATALLAGTYLAIWLGVGLALYVVLAAFALPPEFQNLAGGLALGLAGIYALTPIKKGSEARCRELCCLHGPLPFNLFRSAMVVGVKYALSCIGCSAGVMVALLIIGMSSVGWMVILAGVLLAYKLGPPPNM